MEPILYLKLSPYQKGKLKPLKQKVNEAWEKGRPGAVMMQPCEDEDCAGVEWTMLRIGFVPYEKARRIVEILNEK